MSQSIGGAAIGLSSRRNGGAPTACCECRQPVGQVSAFRLERLPGRKGCRASATGDQVDPNGNNMCQLRRVGNVSHAGINSDAALLPASAPMAPV